MKKLLSIVLLSALACGAFATTWYFDPASTKEKSTARAWNSANNPKSLITSGASILKDGDTVLIKGGVFRLSATTQKFVFTKNLTIIGGFDPSLTGTDQTMPTYPSPTPTIIDGDINKDGVPSKGDAPALFRVDFQDKKDYDGTITIQGIVFRNTYYDNNEEATQDLKTYLADAAALRLICGTAYIKNCEFYNHVTPINRGSQCVTAVGCNLHMMDCDLHHCVAFNRGALLRMRSYFIGGVESNTLNGDCVLERCALHDASTMAGTAGSGIGEYGGAAHISAGDIFAINTTFACDTNYSKGAAVRPNPGCNASFISCTFVMNYGARVTYGGTVTNPYSYGTALGMDHDTKFKLANTIIVDEQDDATKTYPPIYADDNTVSEFGELCTTGGNNILGTIWMHPTGLMGDYSEFFLASDKWTKSESASSVQKFSKYFNSISDLKDNGGCSKTILPKEMLNGGNVDDLQALADEWCPDFTSVDASVDQRGYQRDAEVTCVGAAALEAKQTALPKVGATIQGNTIKCNILGQPVDDNYRGIVIQNGKKYIIQ